LPSICHQAAFYPRQKVSFSDLDAVHLAVFRSCLFFALPSSLFLVYFRLVFRRLLFSLIQFFAGRLFAYNQIITDRTNTYADLEYDVCSKTFNKYMSGAMWTVSRDIVNWIFTASSALPFVNFVHDDVTFGLWMSVIQVEWVEDTELRTLGEVDTVLAALADVTTEAKDELDKVQEAGYTRSIRLVKSFHPSATSLSGTALTAAQIEQKWVLPFSIPLCLKTYRAFVALHLGGDVERRFTHIYDLLQKCREAAPPAAMESFVTMTP
jgi:hypothetical protein